jgi:hypothetical protein
MKATIVSQYSVFLVNKPGALEKFAKLIYESGLDIVGISSDIRYEAAVVKFVTVNPKKVDVDASQIITKAGYTSVKTDVICLEEASRAGLMMYIGAMLGKAGINITTIYGSSIEDASSRLFIVVDDLENAIEILNNAPNL